MWTLNHKSSILTGKKPRYPSLDSAAMKALFILLIALTASCNQLKKMCKEEDPVQQLITNEASIQKNATDWSLSPLTFQQTANMATTISITFQIAK